MSESQHSITAHRIARLKSSQGNRIWVRYDIEEETSSDGEVLAYRARNLVVYVFGPGAGRGAQISGMVFNRKFVNGGGQEPEAGFEVWGLPIFQSEPKAALPAAWDGPRPGEIVWYATFPPEIAIDAWISERIISIAGVPQIAVRIVSADLPHRSEDEVWQADPVQSGRVSNFNFAWIWRGGSNA